MKFERVDFTNNGLQIEKRIFQCSLHIFCIDFYNGFLRQSKNNQLQHPKNALQIVKALFMKKKIYFAIYADIFGNIVNILKNRGNNYGLSRRIHIEYLFCV